MIRAPIRAGTTACMRRMPGQSLPRQGASDRKDKNLRAILRAPEVIQTLYREGLVSQTVAASMGPAAL